MTSTLVREGYVDRFARAFAAHWGLEVDPLRTHLIAQLKRMADVPEDERTLKARLAPLAMSYRNGALRPVLRDLYDALGARLSHRFGGVCRAQRDDAVSQTVMLVLRYWKPWWSRPEGQEHLRRYGALAAVHALLRLMAGEKARQARLQADDRHALDAEAQLIRDQEERERERAADRVGRMDWLLAEGLTPAEAAAVQRSLSPQPTAGLDQRAEAAWRKALQRAKARLRTIVDRLTAEDRPAPSWCMVEHLGLRGRFEVVESSPGGLWLEGPEDDAQLELGAVCTVHVHYAKAVIARGARCVRIERGDGTFRIALEYLFRACKLTDTQPTL